MHITRVIVENYRCLKSADVTLNHDLNIIVGSNECGKSTLLEAVNLALTGQLNGRPIQAELHPYLFNSEVVATYISNLIARRAAVPPKISIELYFNDEPALTALKGINNSQGLNVPGVRLIIEFNSAYAAELAAYVTDPSLIRTLPIEYYTAKLIAFTDNDITPRSIPIKPAFIDASTIRNNAAASRYVIDIMRDSLTPNQRVDLALSYRLMKDRFMEDTKVKGVNSALAEKKGGISDKVLSMTLDTSSRSTWEMGVMPHLDNIPLTLVGKGEQNTIKIKLAMESSAGSHLILIEEPENHLSFSNLNTLISHVANNRGSRQLLITTHSSFVLNKLGLESVVLFSRGRSMRLNALKPGTQDYFMKLPGHDTLRLILAARAILVEGPSDELIVQAAYKLKHGKLPLEDGIDVISVNSLAFKRFLEIAETLKRSVSVMTDNDGSVAALKGKYADYLTSTTTRLCYDNDEEYPTLEPQLLKASGKAALEKVLGKTFSSPDDLLKYMKSNKADVALKFFTTAEPWNVPGYVEHAIS